MAKTHLEWYRSSGQPVKNVLYLLQYRSSGLKIGKHNLDIIKDTTNYGYERRRTQQDIAETYREVL